MRRWAWTGILAVAIASASHAQLIQRQFPPNSQLGVLVGGQHPFPLVQINNKVLRLAPGGLIYDGHNRTILHNVLPEQAHVLFIVDMNGDIGRIFILRPDELARFERAGPR